MLISCRMRAEIQCQIVLYVSRAIVSIADGVRLGIAISRKTGLKNANGREEANERRNRALYGAAGTYTMHPKSRRVTLRSRASERSRMVSSKTRLKRVIN